MRIEHLINGQRVAGSDYFETINPATQEVLATVASGGEAVNDLIRLSRDRVKIVIASGESEVAIEP